MVILRLRTSVSRKSLPLVAASSTGLMKALSGSLNVPRIEAKVSSACDSMLAKAVLAWLLRKGFFDSVCRYAFNSLPSPDDRR